MEHESWERATAVNGLLANEIRIDEAHELVESAVETQTSAGQLAYGYGDQASFRESRSREWTKYDLSSYFPTANTASMASSVLEFYDRTGDERYLDAVRKQYEYFETVDRTRDGGISRRDGPIELFTEVLYFLCPWYVRYGLLTDNDEPVEDAVHQIKIHAKHLQDPHTGLFRHIWRETPDYYPASEYWGRGVGWATAGLIDTLGLLPEDHSERETVREILERVVDGLLVYQDDTGFWRQRVDDTKSPLELSGTAFFTYTIQRALNEGILDGAPYAAAAEKGMDACIGAVREDGAVQRVAKPPASSFAPLGITSYGQGSFLLAASCFV
nr:MULTISPECIES: glycoside hydrolase family 88 protein [unclassified Haladaptatus]